MSSSKGFQAVASALRALADAIEQTETPAPDQSTDVPRYYTRSTAPLEARAWDRAVRALPTFRPGREKMILRSDLHAWIESFVAVPKTSVATDELGEDDDAPISFSEFAASVRRRRQRGSVKCRRCGREFAATVQGNPFAHKCVSKEGRS
jgi:hypothetical protein